MADTTVIGFWSLVWQLAANCIAQGKEDEALQVLHYTTTKYSNSTEALFSLGKIYIGRQQWSEALQYYNLVLEKVSFFFHKTLPLGPLPECHGDLIL
jgi:tetratricopeptide (TPR) repeat protein